MGEVASANGDGQMVTPPRRIILHGHVIVSRNGTAYIGLKNEKGLESFAECKTTVLKTRGISGNFDVILSKVVGFPVEVLLRFAKQESRLLDTEWIHMRDAIRQTLFDNNMSDTKADRHYG